MQLNINKIYNLIQFLANTLIIQIFISFSKLQETEWKQTNLHSMHFFFWGSNKEVT